MTAIRLPGTLSLIRPPEKSSPAIQMRWNEDLIRNLHGLLASLAHQTSTAAVTSTGLDSYDLGFDFTGTPRADEVVGRWFVPRTITLAADFANSGGIIDTNPTATLDLDVQDDGVSIGTVSISTGGAFVFTTTSNTEKVVAGGSEVRLVAPASADVTAKGILITLKGVV